MVIPATAGKGAWNVREPLKDTVSHTLPKVALTAWDRRALATTRQTFSKFSTHIGAPLPRSSTAFNSTFLTVSDIGMSSKLNPQIACGTVLNGVTSLKLHPGLTNEMVEIVGRRRNTYLQLRDDKNHLDDILNRGAERARAIAGPVLENVRRAIGISR